jgi:molecular chaperone DnaK
VTGTVYEVLATGGDSFLGGIDFDACIAEMLAEAFLENEHIDPRSDPLSVARLLHYAEKAKRELSTNLATTVQIDHLVVKPYAARSLSVPLKQARVEQAFEPFIDRTLSVVEEVCQRAGVSLAQVDDILLVGGQTRTPLVRRKVAKLFGRQPISSVHPDYAVALGAAQYAASLESFDNIVLIDALPMSIGVGLPGGRFKKIIERDTRLPVKRKYTLHTIRDDQQSFDILVFQGEDDWVQHNEPLGMLHVPNLPKGPRGSVSVDIDLFVNEENILKLIARETKTGRVVEAAFGTKDTPEELRNRLGLPAQPTHAELQKMKEEANRPKTVWRWLTGLFSRK